MIKFQWPLAAILIIVPLIYKVVANYFQNSNENNNDINNGLVIPYYDELVQSLSLNSSMQSSFQSLFVKILEYITWIIFCIALMRPIFIGDKIELELPTHDIMMAIDISGSMQDEDMSENYRQTRLDVVKKIAHSFIDERDSSRMGLIFFGSQAFMSSPLTLDKTSLHNFLEKTQIGFAGQYTAIGDAIGLAIKRLETGLDTENTRFIILLSDGSNTSGNADPVEAAKVAAKNNIKIYTIGIGKQAHNFLDIQSGRDLDEKTLKEIADITNGQYFHASSSGALANIYKKINRLEPNTQETKTVRPESEWYIYPLIMGLFFSLILFLIKDKI